MPFSSEDIHRVGEILAFAADTEIMPRFRRLTATQIREKSSQFDLVTDADEKAEAVIECRTTRQVFRRMALITSTATP